MSKKKNHPDQVVQRLLKVQDVAEILNIGRSKAYQLIQLEDIPSVRIGKAVRVHPGDLEEYIQKNRVGGNK